jgi:hypothetical protein
MNVRKIVKEIRTKMKNKENISFSVQEDHEAAPADAKSRPGINQYRGDRDLCSRRFRLPTENRLCLPEDGEEVEFS